MRVVYVALRWVSEAQHQAGRGTNMLPPVNGFMEKSRERPSELRLSVFRIDDGSRVSVHKFEDVLSQPDDELVLKSN